MDNIQKPSQGAKAYQLPIIVLVTNFSRDASKPGMLNLEEIDTLFHEMGHAMHSVLAQTDYQHIAGTRVAMDFVEIPSVLMESFAKSPNCLSFGRHYKTGKPVPLDLIAEKRAMQQNGHAHDVNVQIQMAMLDQIYHGEKSGSLDFNPISAYHELQALTNHNGAASLTTWPGHFTHLVGYGSTYYSYLWSRMWADRIYSKLFDGNSANEWRQGGELIRNELLKCGGGRDAWIGLEKVGVVKEGEN